MAVTKMDIPEVRSRFAEQRVALAATAGLGARTVRPSMGALE